MASAGESLVKDWLSKFLKKHDLHDSIDAIDEIVLNYVISILEDLGDDQNAEENIDVEQFTEMMDAYIPGFSNIDSVEVCEWMFALSTELARKEEDNSNTDNEVTTFEPGSPIMDIIGATALPVSDTPEINGNMESMTEDIEEDDAVVKMLLEMFPTSCTLEITHCLSLSNGDADGAAQLIIHRQEIGDSIASPTKSKKKDMVLDDNKVKSHIINRFSYVDTDADKKTHNPTLQKQDSKKLVRYLDNKVVSTKGERFTEIKKEENDDMKKTFINLKPARKYRFH